MEKEIKRTRIPCDFILTHGISHVTIHVMKPNRMITKKQIYHHPTETSVRGSIC